MREKERFSEEYLGVGAIRRKGVSQAIEIVSPTSHVPFRTAVLYTGQAYVLGACL